MTEEKVKIVEQYTGEDREDESIELKENGVIVFNETIDNTNVLPEDIPFPEHWKRVSLDKLKKDFINWLDDSVDEEYLKDPEFYMSDNVNEKRFYMRIIDRGPFEEEEEELEFKEYTCVYVPHDTKRVEGIE